MQEFDNRLIQGCSLTVPADWIDYNGHMNVAYYVMAFDKATDHFFRLVDLGLDYLENGKGSTFTAEMNVSYIREVGEGDPIVFTTQLLGYDEKRLHYFHAMYHAGDGYLAATNECLSLHIDMTKRRVAPIPQSQSDKLAALFERQAGLPVPERAGRVIRTRAGVSILGHGG